MKAKLSLSLVLFAILSSCGSQKASREVSSEGWREDLQALARELPTRHANAFHTVSRETFAAEVARLDAAVQNMNGDQVTVGLMRIVALVGDGHTHLDLPPTLLRYPLEMQWFGDELRVIAAATHYYSTLGARVLAIGSTPIREVLDRTTQLVPRGENDGRTRLTATMLLTVPQVLHGLDVIVDPEKALFALELATGERENVSFSPAPMGNLSDWRFATGDPPPLFLRRLTEPWWTEFLPDSQTAYFSFTRYPTEAQFRENTAALALLLDESKARRLVIDLRRNQGGDLERFRQVLLPILKARPSINRRGGLFVITGPGTFSAATVNALDLRNEANAIIVGAPTGMRPNHWGEHGEFRLPNSGFRISYSTRYYRFAETANDSAVMPDHRIDPTFAEFRAGRDPVMEWILARKD